MEAARLFAKRTLHHDQFTNVLGGEQSDELTGVIYDRQGRRIRFPDHHKRTIKTHLRNERGKPGTHYVRHRRVWTQSGPRLDTAGEQVVKGSDDRR
jgi:hypothetical protein